MKRERGNEAENVGAVIYPRDLQRNDNLTIRNKIDVIGYGRVLEKPENCLAVGANSFIRGDQIFHPWPLSQRRKDRLYFQNHLFALFVYSQESY